MINDIIKAALALCLVLVMFAVVLFARHMDVIAIVLQSGIQAAGSVLQLIIVCGAGLWLIYMFFGFVEKLPDIASRLRPNETHYHNTDNRQIHVYGKVDETRIERVNHG